jgi:hypothetical protein
MKDFIEVVGKIIGLFAGLLLVSFLLSWPVMMLWNGCLVGAIDGVKEIGWLQAWGLQILANFIFKILISRKKD